MQTGLWITSANQVLDLELAPWKITASSLSGIWSKVFHISEGHQIISSKKYLVISWVMSEEHSNNQEAGHQSLPITWKWYIWKHDEEWISKVVHRIHEKICFTAHRANHWSHREDPCFRCCVVWMSLWFSHSRQNKLSGLQMGVSRSKTRFFWNQHTVKPDGRR